MMLPMSWLLMTDGEISLLYVLSAPDVVYSITRSSGSIAFRIPELNFVKNNDYNKTGNVIKIL